MNNEFFEEHYKNGLLTDCMPVSLSLMAFIHKDESKENQELSDTPIRAIYYVPKKLTSGNFGTSVWSHNIESLYISDTGTSWIVTDPYFQISEIDNKTNWYPIPYNEKAQLAKGMVNIDGDVYAYGMVRSVFKRTGIKLWENITSRKEHPILAADTKDSKVRFIGDRVGFSALDGFNGNDIYAGGNKGDCWHYDGKQWEREDLPINSDISTITCAPNGKVYIASRLGSILVGRENKWKIIDEFKEITHSVWFKEKIYFTAKNGRIYTHNEDDKALTEASFKTKYPKYMRHLIVGIASCDECLVIYTNVQAYAYDGENWHEIIELPALSKNK